MPDFRYRTEDFKLSEIRELFVDSSRDRDIVTELKAVSPVVLVGSRGVGKSFLLRVAEAELAANFDHDGVLPVYVSFSQSSLLQSGVSAQFHYWMMSRLCSQLIRELEKRGLLTAKPKAAAILAGSDKPVDEKPTSLEEVAVAFENSWKNPGVQINVEDIPSVDDFKNAVEDLCYQLDIERIAVFFDEAAHVLIPDQQRQFFTLFRDLRSPYLTCNAAVYPGVTSFGDSFQPTHDARVIQLNRDVLAPDYVDTMKQMVVRQAESGLIKAIAANGQNFAILAYAASGNPRILLKTSAAAASMKSQQLNDVIRDFYRNGIWSEHSTLAEKFAGHRPLIDWGRKFIESEVLPETQRKNAQYLATEKNSTAFFWIHRDAPQPVKEALRLLAYTGIVAEHDRGIKATRAEVGTRYSVNLGCLFGLESVPATTAYEIARNLTPKRMTEYGSNHPLYAPIIGFKEPDGNEDMLVALNEQLAKPIAVLDITEWQKDKLTSLGLECIKDVLLSKEENLKQAWYVGDVRARQMWNAAFVSVFEYLSG